MKLTKAQEKRVRVHAALRGQDPPTSVTHAAYRKADMRRAFKSYEANPTEDNLDELLVQLTDYRAWQGFPVLRLYKKAALVEGR